MVAPDPGRREYLGRVRVTPALLVLATVACVHRPPPAARPTDGAIGGVVRDRVTGEPVRANVTVHFAEGFDVVSDRAERDGDYEIVGLRPGKWDMIVTLPGGTLLHYTGIPVTAGHTTGFDIPVDVATADEAPTPFEEIGGMTVQVYFPEGLPAGHGRIEGTVTDSVTLERVAGAVVYTATDSEVLNVVSDDQGRFRFDRLPPGEYDLSAFYQIARRGQIEVRRTKIGVAAGTAVVVPMFIEVTGFE